MPISLTVHARMPRAADALHRSRSHGKVQQKLHLRRRPGGQKHAGPRCGAALWHASMVASKLVWPDTMGRRPGSAIEDDARQHAVVPTYPTAPQPRRGGTSLRRGSASLRQSSCSVSSPRLLAQLSAFTHSAVQLKTLWQSMQPGIGRHARCWTLMRAPLRCEKPNAFAAPCAQGTASMPQHGY